MPPSQQDQPPCPSLLDIRLLDIRWAVRRCCQRVNPSRRTRRYKLNRDVRRRDCAFIPDDMRVATTGIHERHSLRVYVRLAFRIVTLVVRKRSRRHDDQAVSRVRVPPGTPSRYPCIALHVKVG